MSSCWVYILGHLILVPRDFGLFGWKNLHQEQMRHLFLHAEIISSSTEHRSPSHQTFGTLSSRKKNIIIAVAQQCNVSIFFFLKQYESVIAVIDWKKTGKTCQLPAQLIIPFLNNIHLGVKCDQNH
jgi:hypothetical protein